MSEFTNDVKLPIIDFTPYLSPTGTSEEKQAVITQVREACHEFGFFQVKGHGVPLESQRALISSIDGLFGMPKEDKMKLSFLNNPSRRGYEASGMSMRKGDALPDSKEVYHSFFLFFPQSSLLIDWLTT